MTQPIDQRTRTHRNLDRAPQGTPRNESAPGTALGIVVAAFCVGWVFPPDPLLAQSAPQVRATVVVRPATVMTFHGKATGFGRVQSEPAKMISVDAPHDGTLLKVYVRAGEAVTAGTPLAELSAAPSTEESYRKAQAAADLAKSTLDREQYLWSHGATTKDKLDQAQAANRDAQATLRAQTQLGAQEVRQTLSAPAAGTVISVQIAEGDQVTQSSKILTIAPSDALAVLLGVEPEDVRNIRLGMPLVLIPPFDPEKRFSGTVSSMNNVVDPQTRLVDVVAELAGTGSDQPLIGTEMRGEIALDEVRALGIPREALLYDGNDTYVFVDHNGRAVRIPVSPGAEEGGNVAISGAIKPGDQVVIQGNYELQDGMAIEQATRGVE